MRLALALVAAFAAIGQDAAKPAAGPTPAKSLIEIATKLTETPAEAAVGWLQFAAAGYKKAADLLGKGNAADAELALGGAMEKAVPAFCATLVGKKLKVKLNETAEGTVAKVEEGGITLMVNKAELLVAWPDIDPAKIAFAWAKSKPTSDEDVASLAVLKALGGEIGDAKKNATKLTGELGKKLGEFADDWKAVGPEMKAARALDAALRETDPVKGTDKLKAAWGDAKASKLGGDLKDVLREQFMLRAVKANAGDVALNAAFHGKVKRDPARASPAAGPGGVGLEIEYEFEKDSEGPDFDASSHNQALLGFFRNMEGGTAPAVSSFKVEQSRLIANGACGGPLPLEFGGDMEMELQGGIVEAPKGNDIGGIVAGWVAANGKQFVALDSFVTAIAVLEQGKRGPNTTKKIEDVRPGLALSAILRYSGGKLYFTRNGEAIDPPLEFALAGPVEPFIIASSKSQWYVERVLFRGTVTRTSLEGLAVKIAEKDAAALFDG